MNFSNVNTMTNAFSHCSSLKSIDLSNFDTSKVTAMRNLFYNCSSLEKIELNKYKINITDLSGLFAQCSSLINITLSVDRVQTISNLFKGCYSLQNLDLSEFHANSIISYVQNDIFPEEIENVTIYYNSSIFGSLEKRIPDSWIKVDVSNITDYSSLLYNKL